MLVRHAFAHPDDLEETTDPESEQPLRRPIDPNRYRVVIVAEHEGCDEACCEDGYCDSTCGPCEADCAEGCKRHLNCNAAMEALDALDARRAWLTNHPDAKVEGKPPKAGGKK